MIFPLLYGVGMGGYGLLMRAAAPFHPKAKLWVQGRQHVWQQLATAMARDPHLPAVWFHCASLGEFEQARPVLEALKAERPDVRIVLTFFSPSGYEIRKNYAPAHVVCYLPLDTAANARRFVQLVQPQLALFAKYEFWFNYLTELHRKQIPTAVFSAVFRPEQPFFKPWGVPWRQLLAGINHLFVQTEESRDLLAGIGITQVTVAGDTRFDRVAANAATPFNDPIIQAFAEGKKVIAVGSAWPEDVAVLLHTLPHVPQFTGLLVAPHEMDERFLKELEATCPQPVVRYTQATPHQAAEAGTLIVDTIGKLAFLYRYAQVAWIGGAFGKGLHNALEAVVYGLPVLFGPRHTRFPEAKLLIEAGAGWSVTIHEEAIHVLQQLADPKGLQRASTEARNVAEANRGATKSILAWALQQLGHTL